jgi:hypothetical protein
MSEITTRTVVKSLKFTWEAAKTSFDVGKAICTAAKQLHTHYQAMSIPARQIIDQTQLIDSNATILQPSIELKQQVVKLQQEVASLCQQKNISQRETALAVALVTSKLFLSSDSQVLEQGMQALQNNPNSASLEAFNQQLFTNHQSIFTDHAAVAVQSANLKVGFKNFEVTQTISGIQRIIATDDRGRTLVTEIGTAIDREPTIATEVIGMSDSSCSQILDDFDRALEEAGVQSSRPERKSTAGVCELEAAKEFIRRQPIKSKTALTKKVISSTQPRQVTQRQQNQQF